MTIFTVLTQIVFVGFFLLILWIESSKRYRDCGPLALIRLFLMVASAILYFKVGALANHSVGVQIVAFIGSLAMVKFLYEKVLKRHVKIRNFKLKQLYLGNPHGDKTYR